MFNFGRVVILVVLLRWIFLYRQKSQSHWKYPLINKEEINHFPGPFNQTLANDAITNNLSKYITI